MLLGQTTRGGKKGKEGRKDHGDCGCIRVVMMSSDILTTRGGKKTFREEGRRGHCPTDQGGATRLELTEERAERKRWNE